MEATTTVLDSVLDVFSSVGNWITEAVQNLIPMFYNDNALTFVGVLAVSGLAVAVTLLILNIIKGFLQFR